MYHKWVDLTDRTGTIMAVELQLDALREAVRGEMRGLSYNEAAKLIPGVSKQTLHRVLAGSFPDLETFVRLVSWSGVDICDVITEAGVQGDMFGHNPVKR